MAHENLKLRCECGQLLSIPGNAVGRMVACPHCSTKLRVPLSPPVKSAPTTLDAVRFRCPCGHILASKKEAAGKLIACPQCMRKLRVPGTPSDATGEPFSRPTTAKPQPSDGYADLDLESLVPTVSNISQRREKSLTVDNNSQASNPGRLTLHPLRWILFYPKWPLGLFSVLAIATWGALQLHWALWILVVPLALMNFLYWVRVKEHFRSGCVNAAMIVSIHPPMYAANSDLSMGQGSYPAIRIVSKKAPLLPGQAMKIGARLPCVALYQPSFDNKVPHWAGFDPKPAFCASNDEAAVASMMDSISNEDWQELEQWLKQVPQPYQPGLYMISEDFQNWK